MPDGRQNPNRSIASSNGSRHVPGAPKVHQVLIKQFGTKAHQNWTTRVFVSEPPFYLDSCRSFDRREIEYIREQLISRQADIELAWGDQSKLDIIFKESENAGKEALQAHSATQSNEALGSAGADE